MGQQQVKALTDRTKSGRGIKSSLKTKDVEKSEFHTAPGMRNRAITLFKIPNRMYLISDIKPH